MRIISLNTYTGVAFEPLMAFIAQQAPQTDVFCFQEVNTALHPDIPHTQEHLLERRLMRMNLLQEMIQSLPDFEMRFAPMQDDLDVAPNVHGKTQIGLAVFVRKTLPIRESGDFFLSNGYNTYVSGNFETLGFNAVYVGLDIGGTPLTICTVHGISHPGHKLDTPVRLAQSEKLLAFLAGRSGEKIVMGDFNLFPDTESIRMIERTGLRNLIRLYDIQDTRGTLNKELHPQYAAHPGGHQRFADYAFVSQGITVHHFEVPDVPVSDHLPMMLTCTVSS
ncbi:MAG: hypothetical protein RL141_162 [Candidatus Parcubacteria bacterium]|jgi:endonuclease/exonuclease/phosphatase family metal-dependent hydrolase